MIANLERYGAGAGLVAVLDRLGWSFWIVVAAAIAIVVVGVVVVRRSEERLRPLAAGLFAIAFAIVVLAGMLIR